MLTLPIRPLRSALDHLIGTGQALTDTEALGRFVHNRDEDAFCTLVHRYGPLVAGVCQRLLGHRPEADDAVQATFWALSRQAASIRDPRTLPAWLHSVAYRAARKAVAHRPIPLEVAQLPVSSEDPLAEATWREVRQLLDEEVNRLPQQLRLPILLCYFEERTRDEAAACLGCSLSTLKRRLDLARTRLQNRLQRRGVASGMLAAAGLFSDGLSPRLTPLLEEACLRLLYQTPPAVIRLLAVTPPMTFVGRWIMTAVLFVGFGSVLAAVGGPEKQIPLPNQTAKLAAAPVVDEPLPPGALHRFGTTRFRCNTAFWFGSFSRDGKWFVSGADGVELWDLQTGLSRRLRPVRNNTVPRPTISPDGSVVAVLDGGPGVHLLDARTGKELRTLGSQHKFSSCCFSPDGKGLVATTDGPASAARGFAVSDGKEQFVRISKSPIDHRLGIWNDRVVFMVLIGGPVAHGKGLQPLTLQIVDVETGKTLRTIETAATDYPDPTRELGNFLGRLSGALEITSFAISPDGGRFAYQRADGTTGLVNLTRGPINVQLASVSATSPFRSNRLWFSPDGKSLFGADYSGKIVQFDATTGKVLGSLAGHRNGVGNWHLDATGQKMITAGQDGCLRRWDLKTHKEISPPSGYSHSVRAVFSPDGTLTIVGDRAGTIDIYETKSGIIRQRLPRPTDAVDWCTFALSPDGQTLAATQPDGAILWWDVVNGKQRVRTSSPFPRPDQAFHSIESLVFSPDGRQLACGQPNGNMALLDTATRQLLWRASLPVTPSGADAAKGVAFSADGKRIARALRNGQRTVDRWSYTIQILDAKTGEQVAWRDLLGGQFEKGAVSDVHDLRYSPDGRTLVIFSRNGRIVLLDAHSLAVKAMWSTGSRDGLAMNLSPDGRTLITGDENGTLKLWELATGKSMGSIGGHRGHVSSGVISSDGRVLLTGGYDKVAYTWSLLPDRLANTDKPIDVLRGNSAERAYQAVWDLARNPQGPALLRSALPPARGASPEAVQGWIADIDDDSFAVREAASTNLTRAGWVAEAAMRKALLGMPTAEAGSRLRKVLAKLAVLPSEQEVFETRGAGDGAIRD